MDTGSETLPKRENYIGTRRSKSWWEPSYDPLLEGKLRAQGWDFENSSGPRQAFLHADMLKAIASDGEVQKITGVTFADCNIQGDFEHNPSILFDGCRFLKCDFGFSTWTLVNFRNCEFKDCSISQTLFERCEIRDCKFERIGFVGNKTIFKRTFLTNPDQLIAAGFSGSDPKRAGQADHVAYQAYRLEGTKAHVARTLLLSHQDVGDDDTFYLNAKIHDLQRAKAAFKRNWYDCRYTAGWKSRAKILKAVLWKLEYLFLLSFGFINGWGVSLFRPLLFIFLSFLGFGVIYSRIELTGPDMDPWRKSFEIATLAGYTNQSRPEQLWPLWTMQAVQLSVSIFLYTVFFSTLVSRLSRTR